MSPINGVILAGGQGSRMHNPHKPLLPLAGKSLLARVIALAAPQVNSLVLSVPEDQSPYAGFGLPLIKDLDTPCQGPLVGICSAMQWLHSQAQDTGCLACFPADVPVFPADLVATLQQALAVAAASAGPQWDADTVAWCLTGTQAQPLFSLWPLTGLPRLLAALAAGIHGPKLLFQSHPNLPVQLPPPDALQFFNINTPDQLACAERQMTGH